MQARGQTAITTVFGRAFHPAERLIAHRVAVQVLAEIARLSRRAPAELDRRRRPRLRD